MRNFNSVIVPPGLPRHERLKMMAAMGGATNNNNNLANDAHSETKAGRIEIDSVDADYGSPADRFVKKRTNSAAYDSSMGITKFN